MKIITICGSYKFKKQMTEICEKLTLEGNCVFAPNGLARADKESYTQEEMLMLAQMHKEKIKLSDAVFIVDIDGYIGNSTKSEIELAQALDKEIIYYSKISV
ncbi:MAG: hypothetical protein IKC06_01445 [Clostridia bacterium]|nr:hypothetical protein [Clostridia bacterium]MBR2914456.1 hypothetical protein [Clostridia bacterium]